MDTQSMQIRCPKEKARAAFSNFSTLRFQKSVFTGTICMIMSTHTHTICMSYVIFTIVFIITNYLHISTAVRVKLSPVHVHDTTTGMWLRYKSTYTDTTCRSGGTVCTYEKQKNLWMTALWKPCRWGVWPDDEPTKVYAGRRAGAVICNSRREKQTRW